MVDPTSVVREAAEGWQVWVIGRVYTTRDDADLAAAKAFQKGITFTPLFPGNYSLPTNLATLAHEAVQAVVNPSAPGVRFLVPLAAVLCISTVSTMSYIGTGSDISTVSTVSYIRVICQYLPKFLGPPLDPIVVG